MPLSLYRVSVATVLRQLEALDNILQLAEAHARARSITPAALLTMRLYPDMLTLAEQVQAVALLSVRGLGWLAGVQPPTLPMFSAAEDFAALRARLATATGFVAGLAPQQLEGSEEKRITVTANSGVQRVYRGVDYLTHYCLPNLFFHVTVAYGLLRHAGVELGKRHYLGVQPVLDESVLSPSAASERRDP